MTSPLDEKGLEAARASFVMENSLERAIRAYLSTAHAPDGLEVVAVAHFDDECEICVNPLADAIERLDPVPGESWSLVRADQAQSALAAAREEMVQLSAENEAMAKDAQNAWAKHGGTEIALGQWKARAETAEAEVKRLTEANEALRAATATPEAVYANMLRGGIPKLSIRQALHLHGAEALEKWDGIEAADARIKALEEAIQGLNVTDQELVRIHNSCTGVDGEVQIWSKMLHMLVANIIAVRATLNSREKVE